MIVYEPSKSYSRYLTQEDRYLIALSMVPAIGPRKSHSLLRYFRSATGLAKASVDRVSSVPGLGPKIANSVVQVMAKADEVVDQQFRLAEKCQAKLVRLGDQHYPGRLADTFDPPGFLWVRGDLAALRTISMAVVGTRHASEYGRRMSLKFAKDLVRFGYTIVSGLAYGIDTEAHRGALAEGGRTVAILGSGVDIIYPSSNRELASRILERGCLVSEFAMGTKPDPGNFPKRNRIISGMSEGTLVAEAREKGGALITATMALDQNREVFAVPGHADSKKSSGSNALIRDGHAKCVLSVEDIIAEFSTLPEQVELFKKEEADLSDLNPSQTRILGLLSVEGKHIDQIALALNISISESLICLLELELMNLVRQLPGKNFERAPV